MASALNANNKLLLPLTTILMLPSCHDASSTRWVLNLAAISCFPGMLLVPSSFSSPNDDQAAPVALRHLKAPTHKLFPPPSASGFWVLQVSSWDGGAHQMKMAAMLFG